MMDLKKFLSNGHGGCNSSVMCPSCGDMWTHHMGVEVITRYQEDDKKGTRVTVKDHHVSFSNDAERKNPSERRDGIVIRFSCEMGCDDFILTFAQHKGVSYIDCEVLCGQGNEWHRKLRGDDVA